MQKILVVFDSMYGNTAELARAIDKSAINIKDTNMEMVKKAELVVVGSPTQGGRPTAAMTEWLAGLPEESIKGKKVAAFDTRIEEKEQSVLLRLVMKVIGYAAEKIAAEVSARGGTLAGKPQGFIVEGKEGKLKQGEVERAKKWARDLMKGM